MCYPTAQKAYNSGPELLPSRVYIELLGFSCHLVDNIDVRSVHARLILVFIRLAPEIMWCGSKVSHKSKNSNLILQTCNSKSV